MNHIEPVKSKTKCLAFGLKHDPPVSILFNDFRIPWSGDYKHLGHVLYRDGSLKLDVELKTRSFIGKCYE